MLRSVNEFKGKAIHASDGELVFTKSMLGRYPDPDDVVPLLHARLG